MFKKVELWAVGVLCLVGFSAVVLASAMARLTAGGDERFGANDVVIYDFARDETSSPYLPSLRALDVRTPFEGRSKVLPDGDVIVEETEAGRILRLPARGPSGGASSIAPPTGGSISSTGVAISPGRQVRSSSGSWNRSTARSDDGAVDMRPPKVVRADEQYPLPG